jgi:hypothetical protein
VFGTVWSLRSYNPNYHDLCKYSPFSRAILSISSIFATRYGLGGPRIGFRWGRDFPYPSRPALWPNQPSVQRLPCLLPWGKVAVASPWSPPSSAEVKERVQLYLCSTCGPSWPVLSWTLPYLTFSIYMCLHSVVFRRNSDISVTCVVIIFRLRSLLYRV